MDKYPAIYNHLLQYKKQLSNRNKAETGIRYERYALQRWGAKYMDDFSKQKIIFSEIVRQPQFYYDSKGEFFVEATSFLITGENLKHLVDRLNSPIIARIFKRFYAGGGLGEDGYRYKKAFLENLPLPKPNTKNTGKTENNIYESFLFNEEEIKFISSSVNSIE